MIENKEVGSGINEQKVQKKLTGHERIYFSDLLRLLDGVYQEALDCGEPSVCCMCLGRDDSECDCVKKLEDREGRGSCVTEAMFISLEEAFELIKMVTDKVTEAIIEKSFICKCPPEKKLEENS
jgi:hypothetical protein